MVAEVAVEGGFVAGVGDFGFELGEFGFWRGRNRQECLCHVGILHRLPFVEHAGVSVADNKFQERLSLVEVLGFCGVGDGLGEDFVNLAEVAEEDGFGAFEFVGFHIVLEGLIVLDHLAGDGLGFDVFAAEIGVAEFELVEGGVDEFGSRFGVFDLL